MHLLIQLQKVMVRFEKETTEKYFKPNTQEDSNCSSQHLQHSRGRRCITSEAGERALLSTYLPVEYSLPATSWSHFHKRIFTSLWELHSLVFKTSVCLMAQLYLGQSQRRGALKKSYKTLRLIQALWASFNRSKHSQSSIFTTNDYEIGVNYRNLRNSSVFTAGSSHFFAM